MSEKRKPFVTNCLIIARPGDGTYFDEHGAYLDRMAIIPREYLEERRMFSPEEVLFVRHIAKQHRANPTFVAQAEALDAIADKMVRSSAYKVAAQGGGNRE